MGPGQHWAQQQTADRPIRWKGLEIAAFSRHPRVTRALGPTREEKREARQNPEVPWLFYLALPAILVGTLLMFYPAVAFLLLADGQTGRFDINGIDAAVAVPLAGVVLLVGGIVHAVSIARRHRREPSDTGLDAVAVLFGALDVLAIARRGRGEDVTAWPWWLVVAALVVAVGVTGIVHGRSRPHRAPLLDDAPRMAARREVARLSDAAREAIGRDLDAAVGDLERRGLVTRETADRARAADLAMLSIAVG